MTHTPRHYECPVLYGERLTLEPLMATHAEALFALLRDAQLWRFTDDKPPESADRLRERYHRLEARHSPDGTQGWLNWALRLSQAGVLGGFVQATVSDELGSADVAYIIAKRFWSLGLGTEAVRVVVAFLTSDLRITSVGATVDERNIASLRVLLKLGFRITDASDGRNLALELVRTGVPDTNMSTSAIQPDVPPVAADCELGRRFNRYGALGLAPFTKESRLQ